MRQKALRVGDYLGHLLVAIQRIRRYTANKTYVDFTFDEQLQDAVVRNIEIIGEAARNIERDMPDFAALHPQVPWSALYAMLNRVAHGYWTVDREMVWQVVQRDLPILEEQIQLISKSRVTPRRVACLSACDPPARSARSGAQAGPRSTGIVVLVPASRPPTTVSRQPMAYQTPIGRQQLTQT